MRKCLMLIFVLVLTACREEILHDLSEAQANQVWTALEKREIRVKKDKGIGGWTIAVERSSAVRSLQLLQELKLPYGLWREKDIENSSIIPSKEERQLNREKQLAKSIEGSLRSLPGIADAHVHLVIPANDTGAKSTASVLVIADGVSAIQPQQIRDLVAGATSISKESVAVALVGNQETLSALKVDLSNNKKGL